MIHFDNHKYKKEAVVNYIFSGKKVLLIKKLRGLGAGKINVPGGHIERGESPYKAAVRETIEEVSLNTENLELMGYLYFRFTDGLTMKGWVYRTFSYSGVEKISEEAIPFWEDIDTIPYNKMWEDDIVWIPQMLKDRFFRAYFKFDGDKMIKREVEFYDNLEEFNP